VAAPGGQPLCDWTRRAGRLAGRASEGARDAPSWTYRAVAFPGIAAWATALVSNQLAFIEGPILLGCRPAAKICTGARKETAPMLPKLFVEAKLIAVERSRDEC
jgi:hypothetical protein